MPFATKPALAQIDLAPFRELPASTRSAKLLEVPELIERLVTLRCWEILEALGPIPEETIHPDRTGDLAWIRKWLEILGVRGRPDWADLLVDSIDAEDRAVFALVAHAAEVYPDYFRGKRKGPAALFTRRSLRLWERYFSNQSPSYEPCNALAAYARERALEGRAAVRVLEVGGGCGSAAEALVKRMGDSIEKYRFTEPSGVFLRRAERRLRHLSGPPVIFGKADLAEASSGGPYDLILSVNVLHALDEPTRGLECLAGALAPRGSVVLGETIRSHPKQPVPMEFVFRMTHAFTGFLTADQWRTAFQEAGLTIQLLPETESAIRVYRNYPLVALLGRPKRPLCPKPPTGTARTWKAVGGGRPINAWDDTPELEARGLSLRAATPEDAKPLNALFNRSFSARRPIECFHWKFGRLDWLHVLCDESGQPVGQLGHLPRRVHIGHAGYHGAVQADLSIDPRYRLGGVPFRVFARVAEMKAIEQGVSFAITMPNRTNYIVGKRFLRYRDLCQIQPLRRRLTPARWLHERLGGPTSVRKSITKLGASAWRFGGRFRPRSRGVREVRNPGELGEEIEKLCRDIPNTDIIRMDRSAPWLQHRLADHPLRPYRFLGAWESERFVGYVVLRKPQLPPRADSEPIRSALIMDLLALPGVERRLLAAAENHAARMGADELLTWEAPATPYGKALTAQQYKPYGEAFPVVIWTNPDQPNASTALSQGDRWHFSPADTDDL